MNNPRLLDEAQRQVIVDALLIAQAQYRHDSEFMKRGDQSCLGGSFEVAKQFEKQQLEASEMAFLISTATKIEITSPYKVGA